MNTSNNFEDFASFERREPGLDQRYTSTNRVVDDAGMPRKSPHSRPARCKLRVSSAEDMCIFDRKTVNLGRAVLPSTCKIAQLQPHTDESTRSEQMILRVCVCVCEWGGKSRF